MTKRELLKGLGAAAFGSALLASKAMGPANLAGGKNGDSGSTSSHPVARRIPGSSRLRDTIAPGGQRPS